MAAQERIERMQRQLAAAAIDLENGPLEFAPHSVIVTYHDGPGVQFLDREGRPMLPDLIRDADTASILFNTLRRYLPPSPQTKEPE